MTPPSESRNAVADYSCRIADVTIDFGAGDLR
jgi:hypothetical protein